MTKRTKLIELGDALSEILAIWKDADAVRRWVGPDEANLPMTPEEFVKTARELRNAIQDQLHESR